VDDREQQRKVRHRLGVLRHAEEVTGNVAATCRYYGISRPTFYKWLHRYEELGEAGLRDGSSRPHYCPHETRTEIVGKIVYLRRSYHFGPRKIAMYLARYHDITISPSGVWRILKRLDMNRLPASQRYKRHTTRWKRYEKPLPGHRVQVDVKFIEPIGESKRKHYQFTAIDDCTRIRVLRIYPRNNQKTAIQFIDYVLEKLPFRVECIQTDIHPGLCPAVRVLASGRDEALQGRRPLVCRCEPIEALGDFLPVDRGTGRGSRRRRRWPC